MTRLRKGTLLILAAAIGGWAQNASQNTPQSAAGDRAEAYYNYTLAHMYAQLAAEGLERDGVEQAITLYKKAIEADPRSAVLAEELSDVYVQFQLLGRGRSEQEAVLRRDPNNLAAHRILARIYLSEATRGANRQNIDANLLRRSMQEYEKVVELDPRDVDAWILLGRLRRTIQNNDGAQQAFEKAIDLDPKNVDALTELANVYLDQGKSDLAADLYRRAADANPSGASLTRLAGAYEQMGEPGLAAESIRKALQFNPPNAGELRKALAQNLVEARQYDEALAVYEEVAREDPDDPQAFLRLSQLRLQKGNLAGARQALDSALKLADNNIDVRLHEVAVLQAEGKPRDAIRSLKTILDNTRRATYSADQLRARKALMQELASIHLSLDETSEAVSLYREIATVDPAEAPLMSAAIIDTYRSGRLFDEARKEADEAGRKWPREEPVLLARASLDAELGRAEEGARSIRTLLGNNNDRRVYLALAELYEKGKLWDQQAAALNEAEKLSTRDEEKFEVWFRRGAMFERQKDVAKAEAEFRKCLNLYPDNASVLNYLGYMLADRNLKLNEALEMIEKAVKSEPANGAFLDSLGWVYYRLGRFDEAEQQIRRAVELSPADPTMHDHFADVLLQRAKTREAIAAWEESLRQWQRSSPAERDPAEIQKVQTKLDSARERLNREGRQ